MLLWSITKWMETAHTLQHTLDIPGGEDGQEFPELSPDHTASGGNGTVAAPTAQHVTQIV